MSNPIVHRRRFLRSLAAVAVPLVSATGFAGESTGGASGTHAENTGTSTSGSSGTQEDTHDAPPPNVAPSERRLVVVVFGGGTRSSEAIDEPTRRFIPKLAKEMIPRGTLFTNMRVERLVVHPNSVGSIKTGHWEWEHLDWTKPVEHPTIFEIVRRQRDLPDTAAWSFVYASILNRSADSSAAGFGQRFAANVVEPPTIPRSTAEEMDRLMRQSAATGSHEAQVAAAAKAARLVKDTSRIATGGLRSEAARIWLADRFAAWQKADGSTSHDALLADLAIDTMQRFSPHVLSVDFGEIDCAHYGSWSRYTDAIRRTDELTWKLWQTIERLPDYRGRTTMLVLPDHGRELERPGGAGFLHHSNFYTGSDADEGCRRVWMLVLGPGIRAGGVIERPAPITAAAATGLQTLGLAPSKDAAASLLKWAI